MWSWVILLGHLVKLVQVEAEGGVGLLPSTFVLQPGTYKVMLQPTSEDEAEGVQWPAAVASYLML